MIRVIADPEVESTLVGVMEPAEIRGSSGELLGYFCPASPETARAYAAASAALNTREIGHRKASAEEPLTTAAVLAHLRSLTYAGAGKPEA
jgi:hypothetical protein